MVLDICLSLAVLIGLGVGTVLTGRAVVHLVRIRMLRRWTPENLLASAFLGTAVWILTFGCCSYLGLAAAPAAAVVVTLSATLLATGTLVRPGAWRAPPRRWLDLAVVVTPVALAALAVLLPVLRGDSFALHTDSLLYDNVAEWLQSHAFREAGVYDPQSPMWQSVSTLQTSSHRMGPIFLLALTRSLCPGCLPVQLFPAVSAWGVALNVAAVYLLCRWAFRCGKGSAFFAALLAGAVNPLSYSAENGFLCQVYGTAILPFSLALLARLSAPMRWHLGEGALFALVAALQLSVYSELSPILAAASLIFLAMTAVRAGRTARLRRFLTFTAATVLLFTLFANVEIIRAVRSVAVMAGLNGVGWHFDWSAAEYWAFAMGTRPYPLFLKPWMGAVITLAAVVGTSLFLAGLWSVVGERRLRPLLAAFLVLGALTAYFHWMARDPWTGAVGHTWNQFKLCKWSYTLVVAAQGAGLRLVLHRFPRFQPHALAVSCLTVVLASGLVHWMQADHCARECRSLVRSNTPLASISELRRAVNELEPTTLYFISQPDADPHYTALITSVLYAHPFLNGWSDKRHPYYDPACTADRNSWPPPDGLLGVMVGAPPFDAPIRRLPCGVSAVELRKPFIVRIDNPDGTASKAGGSSAVRIGSDATAIELWSPRVGQGTFSVRTPQEGLSAAGTVRLVVAPEGAPEREIAFEGGEASAALALRPGLNHVALRRPNARPGESSPLPPLSIDEIRIRLDAEAP